MSSVARLSPIAEPPHDPTSFLLAGHLGPSPALGFRAATQDGTQLTSRDKCATLRLAPSARGSRRWQEAYGTFGGLRLPSNVAVTQLGDVYLLERGTGVLKQLDRCACAFVRRARLPASVSAIAASRSDLWAADPERRAVLRLALSDLRAREPLELPCGAVSPLGPREAWAPFGVVVGAAGTLHVSDRGRGRIDRFHVSGRWLEGSPKASSAASFGPVTHLAVDCEGRLFVLKEDEPERAYRLEADGLVAVAEPPAAFFGSFPSPSFPMDSLGRLHLGQVCGADDASCAIFDGQGNLVPANQAGALDLYTRVGTFTSTALDSEIERCQWHRVVLHGQVPKNASIEVQTTTAQIAWSEAEIEELPADAWTRCAVWRGEAGVLGSSGSGLAPAPDLANQAWDCLIRSLPGRFAWLRLVLRGDGSVTPTLARIEVEFPRISLRRYLPAVYGEEPTSADFTDRFLALFDTSLRSVERQLDTQARLFDPLSAPAERRPGESTDFLTWLGTWLGISLDRHWPEARRRQLLKHAGALFGLRGTRTGLQRMLALYLDLSSQQGCEHPSGLMRCVPRPANCAPQPDCGRADARLPELVLEHFTLRRWLYVGQGRLGDDSVLWGKSVINRSQLDRNAQLGETRLDSVPDPTRDPFRVHAHRFTVFVPNRLRTSAAERKGLEGLLKAEAPAHTEFDVRYVEPLFRVGVQAMIGYDAVVARTPQGVRLGDATLRQGTVLTPPPLAARGSTMHVGMGARISDATKLT